MGAFKDELARKLLEINVLKSVPDAKRGDDM